MRRIRHLSQTNYIVPIGQRANQVLTLSNCSNVLIERTWHKLGRRVFSLKAHAKFNADAMNGIQILARLERDGKITSSVISTIRVYRVNEANWAETLVATVSPIEISNGVFTATITQATLGLNELSGMETYSFEVEASRKRKRFFSKIWLNHLGCFDSILRMKNELHYLNLTKLDE